ncbi:MAG: GAP family protein [Patescibacteria group bacterium]|nr:GAP family protein [Patescibacteria group bacterium]
MLGLLAKIIPLDFAATLSPGIFALTVVLLGSKQNPKLRIISMLTGTLMVGIGIALLGYTIGQVATPDVKKTIVSALIDIILGSFFVFLGLKTFFSKEKKIEFKEDQKLHLFKWLIIGFIINVTNFDALFLSFTAAKEVGSSSINNLDKIILLLVNVMFFILPITLPLFFSIVFPRFTNLILASINHFVLKYSKYIVCILFIIFGFLFLYRGIIFLLN